jgi:mgtE-like transporter
LQRRNPLLTTSQRSGRFVKSFKETLSGHFGGLGGLVAGLIIAWQLGVFQTVVGHQWVIAVYPTVLIAKAVINGIFSGRLNTALHVGVIEPTFKGTFKPLNRMLQRILVLTLPTALLMSIISTLLGTLFWGTTPAAFISILVIVVATMIFGLTTHLLTIPITFEVFKKGLDLDSVAYPISVTVGGIFITLYYCLTVDLYFKFSLAGEYAVILMAIVPMILILYPMPKAGLRQALIRTIRTSMPALSLVSVLAGITGAILQDINSGIAHLNGNGVLQLAAVLAVYPAIIELVSDASQVIESTATTGLILGLLKPYFSSMWMHAGEIFGAWTASAMMFVPLSAASLALTGTFTLHSFYLFTSVLLVTNVFAIIPMILISYAFAILTFKKGLDPDHLVIPVETALAGAITSSALLAALFLLART